MSVFLIVRYSHCGRLFLYALPPHDTLSFFVSEKLLTHRLSFQCVTKYCYNIFQISPHLKQTNKQADSKITPNILFSLTWDREYRKQAVWLQNTMIHNFVTWTTNFQLLDFATWSHHLLLTPHVQLVSCNTIAKQLLRVE